jgi:hypothetical protein
MITVEIVLPQIPYELDIKELIDHIRSVIIERYGISPEVQITDEDIVNIIKLSGMMRG